MISHNRRMGGETVDDAEIQDTHELQLSESLSVEGNRDEEKQSKHNRPTLISTWRYMVAIGSFSVLMLGMAPLLTVGVYLIPLKEEFDSGAGLAGWLASSGVAVMGFSCLASGVFVNKFGCRKTTITGGILMTIGLITSAFCPSMLSLFLTLGLVTGIGAGLAHVPAAVIIGEYFTTSYTQANGIAYVGPGLGLVVYPPLIEKLIDTFGWRGALFIEGAIAFNIVAAACLFRPIKISRLRLSRRTSYSGYQTGARKVEGDSQDYQDTKSNLYRTNESSHDYERRSTLEGNPYEDPETLDKPSSLRDRKLHLRFITACKKRIPTTPIVFVSLIMFLQSLGYLSVIVHCVASATEQGVSKREASLVISVMGASSIFSRLTHGFCIDCGWISVLGTEMFVLALALVITYVSVLMEGFAVLMLFASCIGFAGGVFFALIPVMIRLTDSKARFPSNLGLVYACGAVGDLCGGYFAGLIRDVSGSYKSAYYLSGGAFTLAEVLAVILYIYHKRGKAAFRRKSFSVFGVMELWTADAPLP